MNYVVKLNEEELSFLFNNLESDVNATSHAWYVMMDTLNSGDLRPEFPLILNKEQKDLFYQDMVIDAEIILHQLEMDVRYHSCNDTSWSNSKWCLEIISGILYKIQQAEVIA